MNRLTEILILLAIATHIQAHVGGKSTEKGKSKIFMVTCASNEDCSMVLGGEGECIDNVCTCTNPNGCQEMYNIIGNKCANNETCSTNNAFCSKGVCQCEDKYVTSFDKKNCLKEAGGLQQRCEEDVQCLANVAHSICGQDKRCVCDADHYKKKFICRPYSKLGERCSFDEDCIHVSSSQCGNNSLCECLKGFVPSSNKNECLPIANEEKPECVDIEQCRELYGYGALCLYNICDCDQVHRFVNTTIHCPSRLNRVCTKNDECQNHSDDNSIQCEEGVCICSPAFTEKDGICNGATPYQPAVVIICAVTLFITLFV